MNRPVVVNVGNEEHEALALLRWDHMKQKRSSPPVKEPGPQGPSKKEPPDDPPPQQEPPADDPPVQEPDDDNSPFKLEVTP